MLDVRRQTIKMADKELVTDVLNHINPLLTSCTNAISQTSDPELRSILIQIRSQSESSQNELSKIAVKLKSTDTNCNSGQNASMKNMKSQNNYISSQSNGILDHIDAHTRHALQAPPKTNSIHK